MTRRYGDRQGEWGSMATAEKTLEIQKAILLPIRGHLDIQSGHRLQGWALQGRAPLLIEARLGDSVVARAIADRPRPDVGGAFPDVPNSPTCGFDLHLPPGVVSDDAFAEVVLWARPADHVAVEIGRATLVGSQALKKALSAIGNDRPRGAFPREVANIVDALWPGAADGLDHEDGQSAFVGKLLALLKMPGLQSMEPVVRYVRYLRAAWSHFRFVEAHFPSENRNSDAAAKDYNCRANSAAELMSIAHQLYVLKSYGIAGDFAEFGCFKGFSSSMLSYACAMLGVSMHVFDSFEGLPPSGSAYYEQGDFAGSLEEVRANIGVFGAPQAVTFHKGFFSESLKATTPPKLMCLWMDVDLEVSAEDLLVAIDGLAPEGTLFSHESSPDIFQDGEIVAVRSVDNPIPPLVDKFEALGRPLTGQFVSGNTGAFWSREVGTGIVANRILIELVSSL